MITKEDKVTGEKTKVSATEFLNFVGRGVKKRESAIVAILDGGTYQDLKVMFYIDEPKK